MGPYKGFDGAEMNRDKTRNKQRFEFEKDESSEDDDNDNDNGQKEKKEDDELTETLNRFTSRKDKNINGGDDRGHHKGYMYAAAGGGSADISGNRDKVRFEAVDDDADDVLKAGLFYTEQALKEKERRDKEKEKKKEDDD